MKNRSQYPIFVVLLFLAAFACKKSDGGLIPVPNYSTFSFSANDTMINFPVNKVFIQDVLDVKTTLVTGEYPDTSAKQGNISIRFLGDTTGLYRAQGDSLLITYTDSKGIAYYNVQDTLDFVQIDKFPKTANGMVSGSFHCTVYNGKDSILFSNGVFTAPYQD